MRQRHYKEGSVFGGAVGRRLLGGSWTVATQRAKLYGGRPIATPSRVLQQAIQISAAEVVRQRRYVRECVRVLKKLLVVVDARRLRVGPRRQRLELGDEIVLYLLVGHPVEGDGRGGLVEQAWFRSRDAYVVVGQVLRELGVLRDYVAQRI